MNEQSFGGVSVGDQGYSTFFTFGGVNGNLYCRA